MSTKEIDWSKAPEGFPLWIEEIGSKVIGDGWHREDVDRYTDTRGHYWVKWAEGRQYIVHRKPIDTTWNGTGLPPVGCEIEYHSPKNGWTRGEYVGQFHGDMVVGCNETGVIGLCQAGSVRPIRTPEQIAAEEREKAIAAMVAGPLSGRISARESAEALYDAGYRKTTN